MKKIKINKMNLIKYFLIFIMFLVLANARGYSVSPFGFGALFALMWVGLNVPTICGEYLVANLILFNKIADLYCAIGTIFILIVTYCLHKKIKKPMNVYLVGLYAVLSQIIAIYYLACLGNWIDIAVYLGLGLIFLYVCICLFQVVVLRGWWYKLTLDELICLALFIVVCGLGVAEVYIYDIAVYKYLAIMLLLFCVGVNKKSLSILMCVSVGVGVAIVGSSLDVVGILAVIAIMANIYAYPHRYRVCATTLLGDLAIQLYFIGWGEGMIINLVPTLFAICTFILLPKKIFNNLIDKYQVAESELSVRNVINSTRKNLKRRMGELSDIFAQMKYIHLKLMKDDLEHDQVVGMLAGELSKGVCKDCKYKNSCYKNMTGNKANINKLLDIGLKKGKISILDLPSGLAQKCGIANLLIGRINQAIEHYQKYESMLKDVNNVKFLLAEQMGAISQLMLDLGEEMDKNITFENGLELKIINKLLSQNIVCSEVLLYAERGEDTSVVVIIKGENAYNPNIEKIISGVLNVNMKVDSVQPTDIQDYYSVNLTRASKRDIVFGISSMAKSGSSASGDSHSLIRLGNNKYLLALCDGMGSGENARKMSALAIGLIENFYRAGFDDNFILSSVNKLLSVNNQESFSTLDLCVIDLGKEMIDFIKIGAPYGLIKRENQVEKVENGTIPLGVLKDIKPTISHFAISAKDMIIMVTDGITDSFGSYDELAEFANGIVSTNPQVVAQTILDEAIHRTNMSAIDDMTVLVARTFLKG